VDSSIAGGPHRLQVAIRAIARTGRSTAMRKLRVLVVIVGLLAGSAAALAQIKGIGRLNGKVVDSGGTAIEGVSVRLRQGTDVLETKTDGRGEWVLAGVARGSWMLAFEKDGYETKVVRVVVEKELLRTDPIKVTLTR